MEPRASAFWLADSFPGPSCLWGPGAPCLGLLTLKATPRGPVLLRNAQPGDAEGAKSREPVELFHLTDEHPEPQGLGDLLAVAQLLRVRTAVSHRHDSASEPPLLGGLPSSWRLI